MKEYLFFVLCSWGVFSVLGSAIWMISEPHDKWLWFSRVSLGAICAGFLYIGEVIKEKK